MKKKALIVFAVVTLMSSVMFMQSTLGATYSMGNGQKITYNQSNSTYNNYYSVSKPKIRSANSVPGSSGNTGTPVVPAAPSSGYVTIGNTKVNYGNSSNQNTNYYPVVINKNPGTGSPSTGQPAPQDPPGSEGKHQLTAGEQKLINLINEERKKEGLNPLSIDIQLSKVARIKSEDMRANSYFAHTSPTYGSPFQMMKDFGITYRSAAENIAKTSGVDRAHTGFMNSEGHRKNILTPGFTHIGVGISGNYYTEMFIRK
ncbi:MAG: CAP domain-containing protein [Bacillota bacterium]|nr:CAP domain-containing protein [Bacillota bacterium]MDD3298036.1 CAP domain-containing protein [Bacillota bacterium]MDD4707715.1 CAP domain-containing protein [Bacillota bacterium]